MGSVLKKFDALQHWAYCYADACSRVRLTVVFSDDLAAAIDRVAEEDHCGRAEVLRKALTLYLVAHHGDRHGLKLTLIEPTTNAVETEFVSL
jgi:metal-responsive CopG/Arc/MetJ family transcriptional regulator